MKKYLFLFAGLLFLVASCTKDQVDQTTTYYSDDEISVLDGKLDLPIDAPDEYDVKLPTYAVAGGFGGTPGFRIFDAKATLGRVLFYDKNLSANKEVSCASCHSQERAFSDPVAFSHGFEGEKTLRNSYAIGSTASTRQYYNISRPTLFWDSRARTVVNQSEETLANTIEMGMDMDELIKRVRSEDYYKVLFRKAYGSEEVNKMNILSALEEFVLSFNSPYTKFDEAYNKEGSTFNALADQSVFTEQENIGKKLFMNNCSSCHGQTFTLATVPTANNGLDITYEDRGIGQLSGNLQDYGVFKVPILRNVELTGPYMHDGRFETLEDVIDFYSSGIQDHPNLHHDLRTSSGEVKRFNFDNDEKAAIVAFLKTLTDRQFTTDEKFSDPFIQ